MHIRWKSRRNRRGGGDGATHCTANTEQRNIYIVYEFEYILMACARHIDAVTTSAACYNCQQFLFFIFVFCSFRFNCSTMNIEHCLIDDHVVFFLLLLLLLLSSVSFFLPIHTSTLNHASISVESIDKAI